MKANELVSYWGSPDNSKLTQKQVSLRLPIHVAAKIQALCDMYPQKSRTEIIGDLLTTSLEDLQNSLPVYDSEKEIGHDPDTQETVYEQYGPLIDFERLIAKYHQELEKEAGISNEK